MRIPSHVAVELSQQLQHDTDDTDRAIELCRQIVAMYNNGDPDPSNHADYKLWGMVSEQCPATATNVQLVTYRCGLRMGHSPNGLNHRSYFGSMMWSDPL